ncbi:CGNR zinc finger domain-containing protein [Ilumatobacter sp.]|uniref:CGNR zinc finger domain-containing protein n=1 Tax=Ilumatobacter sp. TaxID=1967498 RepID=UPI003C36017D
MDPLDLDPDGYDGTYKLIGGRLSLDFINTVSWPDTERRHDWLSSPANLDRWCDATGLAAHEATSDSDVDRARELRDELAAAITPLAFGERPPKDAVEQLNSRFATAVVRRRVDPHDLAWTWAPPTGVIDRLAPVVVDAADVVTGERHDRLRHCDACDWLFDDQSRNGRRRWCDMADCGSRAKSRTYYHRTKPDSP